MSWFSGSAAHAGSASGDHQAIKVPKSPRRVSWTADRNKPSGWRPSKPKTT